MITSFDDYCIHQTHKPIAHPAQSDLNHYDRYWFGALEREGKFMFEIGFGVYPNRYVMDGHFSVAIDGEQHSFHGSCRCPMDRSKTAIGPMALTIEEPMRKVRVRIGKNKTGIECDLLFEATSAPTEEPPNILYEDDIHLVMQNSRFTQFGRWIGWFTVNGKRTEFKGDQVLGTRDKSWGVRPVGEARQGAPAVKGREPRVYWAWSPINFGDVATQFGTFEDGEGKATQLSGCVVPIYSNMKDIPEEESSHHQEMENVRHKIKWMKGTRRPESAEIEYLDPAGKEHKITMNYGAHLHMCGIGYQHAEWAHAVWHGEEEIAGESWKLDEVSTLDYPYTHVHTLMFAKMGNKTGVGILENIVYGAHKPSGFKEFLDGAS